MTEMSRYSTRARSQERPATWGDLKQIARYFDEAGVEYALVDCGDRCHAWTRPLTMRNNCFAMLVLALVTGCANAAQPAPTVSATTSKPADTGCLISGNGYLRARLRGALQLDLDWQNAEMACEGGLRPEGSGLRVSIGGPDRGNGRRLRFVFGLSGARENARASALPTNVTVIFEGEQRVFATLGDDKCTVDSLQQERIGALGGPTRSYRVTARGFCTTPATVVGGSERLLLQRFDFAGRIDIEDDQTHATKNDTPAI